MLLLVVEHAIKGVLADHNGALVVEILHDTLAGRCFPTRGTSRDTYDKGGATIPAPKVERATTLERERENERERERERMR